MESVGKRCGHAKLNQPQIHSLLINAAKEGRTVVRLKSGDPLIFGRAGEELDAIQSAGIECVIVPGISAAFGAAARAGIPLTDRRLASHLVFLSNHQCAGKPLYDWKGALSQDTTVLIYMPGSDYETLATRLCADGLSSETPCLIVAHATMPEQEIHLTTLARLGASPRYSAPVLLVVGAVATYTARTSHTRTSHDAPLVLPTAFEFVLTDERAGRWNAGEETADLTT